MRTLLAITLVAVVAGCGILDDRSERRRDRRRAERCEINMQAWERRVERFKEKDRRQRDDFRAAKDALLRDLERLDSRGCRREVRREIEDLIDEVREEGF